MHQGLWVPTGRTEGWNYPCCSLSRSQVTLWDRKRIRVLHVFRDSMGRIKLSGMKWERLTLELINRYRGRIVKYSGELNFTPVVGKLCLGPLIVRLQILWDIGQKGNMTLEYTIVDVSLPRGLIKRDMLLNGGLKGLICLFQVGKVGWEIDLTECIWPC